MRSLVIAVVLLALAASCPAQTCNLKIVTDQSPDYTDMASLIHSVTAKWPTTKEKCWAMWYWLHLARRQTVPINLHGQDLTDPIMQFNDYGYAMCSTIAGVNCGIWHNMGLPVKFWDVVGHTVPECFYDGRWHMYDDSMSAIYTLCDGTTVAGVEDLGKTVGCPASGGPSTPLGALSPSKGKEERGHYILYHCPAATSPNGYLTGADCPRSLASEVGCFNPGRWAYRYYYNSWDWGHRYVLNLREREVYTRCYHRLDGYDPGIVNDAKLYKSDPRYYVPNPAIGDEPKDPERAGLRFFIRGNGRWTFKPALTPAEYWKFLHSSTNIAPAADGLTTADPAKPAEAVFRITGANVITSCRLAFAHKGKVDLAFSTNNGVSWDDGLGSFEGDGGMDLGLTTKVNGAYEVLFRFTLAPKTVLKSFEAETITQLNSKTQPRLNLGRNVVYVGAGEPTETVTLWPELQGESYKRDAVEVHNVATDPKHQDWHGVIRAADPAQDAWLVYRLDAPRDITGFTYGARMYNHDEKARFEFLHSFDGGKTWARSYTLANNEKPWDTIHFETVSAVPPGTKSVLIKYLWNDPTPVRKDGLTDGLYSLRAEARYRPIDPSFKPLEVTFTWTERNGEEWGKNLVRRSHTQLVPALPFRYVINVGGNDTPEVESMGVNVKGALPDVKYGYSDGKDAGGTKFVPQWLTTGKNLATGKTYTVSVPSTKDWGATGDPNGTILTDGVVGPCYMFSWGVGTVWKYGANPVITLDLGAESACAAFGLNFMDMGDLLRNNIAAKTKIEVLTSSDGKEFASAGFLNTKLRWKDIPVNFMMPDDEQVGGFSFYLVPEKPVKTRFVQYKVTSGGAFCPTELFALDAYKSEPFDLRIALPDE